MQPAPEIIYENKDIIVCVKPAGIQSEDGERPGMPSALAKEGRKPLTVHRLDSEVSGIMVYAKTKEAAGRLSAQMADKRFRKEYLAVVGGQVPKRGTMEDLLFHDRLKNKTYVVDKKRAGVKPAALEFERLAETNGMSLVKILLKTGRTHQIRAQFAARKTPVAGDGKYGSPIKCRVALFSHRIGFYGMDGKWVEFEAATPHGFPWSEFPLYR